MNTELHFSNKTDEWATPQYLYDQLNAEFGFTLDPCATAENAKCPRFYTKEDDGLVKDWSEQIVFCNPPYGRVIGKWVHKMATCGAKIVVGLIPAKTDTRYFHDWILGKAEIRFIKGRVKFGDSKINAPFPSMIVIYRSPGLLTPSTNEATHIQDDIRE